MKLGRWEKWLGMHVGAAPKDSLVESTDVYSCYTQQLVSKNADIFEETLHHWKYVYIYY